MFAGVKTPAATRHIRSADVLPFVELLRQRRHAVGRCGQSLRVLLSSLCVRLIAVLQQAAKHDRLESTNRHGSIWQLLKVFLFDGTVRADLASKLRLAPPRRRLFHLLAAPAQQLQHLAIYPGEWPAWDGYGFKALCLTVRLNAVLDRVLREDEVLLHEPPALVQERVLVHGLPSSMTLASDDVVGHPHQRLVRESARIQVQQSAKLLTDELAPFLVAVTICHNRLYGGRLPALHLWGTLSRRCLLPHDLEGLKSNLSCVKMQRNPSEPAVTSEACSFKDSSSSGHTAQGLLVEASQ